MPLTPKAFDVLVALVERHGHVVKKQELIESVWAGSFVEEGNLCVTVSMLRKALGGNGHDRQYIETVSKTGYRFVADVQHVESAADGPLTMPTCAPAEPDWRLDLWEERFAPVSPLVPNPVSPTSQRNTRIAWLLAALLVTSAAASFLVRMTALKPEASALAESVPVRSLAILPFATLGAKTDGAKTDGSYIGLEMVDALITKLGNTGKVVVRPTSAMMKYDGVSVDPQAVGHEQGVDAILDGRIQQDGGRVRLTAQLIRVRDGVQLWADTFDEKFTDIFAVEDAISERVARSIRLELTTEEKKRLSERPTANIDAYQSYLKGRYFWNKRTKEGINKGLGYFRDAVALDPNYAEAYVGIADSYALLGLYTVVSPRQAFPEAREAATKALEIDPSLADAHASLGFIDFYYGWDGLAAESELQRALRGNPSSATAHSWNSENLAAMGRFPEAIAESRRAQEADPLSLIVHTTSGLIYYLAGKNEEAIQAYNEALEIDPNFPRAHFRLGSVYQTQGLYQQAIAEFEKAVQLSGGDAYYEASLGNAYAVVGNVDAARQTLDRLNQKSKSRYVPPYAIALIYAGLGDKNRAFDWLEKAYEDRSTSMAFLKVDPALNSLRSDPRFVALSQRIRF